MYNWRPRRRAYNEEKPFEDIMVKRVPKFDGRYKFTDSDCSTNTMGWKSGNDKAYRVIATCTESSSETMESNTHGTIVKCKKIKKNKNKNSQSRIQSQAKPSFKRKDKIETFSEYKIS